MVPDDADAAVHLYWLPLGAGGHFVRLNGRIYEAVAARLQRRPACAELAKPLHGTIAFIAYYSEAVLGHDLIAG